MGLIHTTTGNSTAVRTKHSRLEAETMPGEQLTFPINKGKMPGLKRRIPWKIPRRQPG
jgi:hypothetical protein